MPRSRLCRCYRVSRSYLHLNRGLTSPLATAMNFIPVSYFWSPLWRLRDAAQSPLFLYYQSSPLLPLLATSGLYSELLRHPFARRSEEEDDEVFDGLFPCANFTRHLLLLLLLLLLRSPHRKQEFRKRPRGREIREGCASKRRESFREKMQNAAAILPLYLGISRLSIARLEISSGGQNTPRHSPHFQSLSSCRSIRMSNTALLIVSLTDVG